MALKDWKVKKWKNPEGEVLEGIQWVHKKVSSEVIVGKQENGFWYVVGYVNIWSQHKLSNWELKTKAEAMAIAKKMIQDTEMLVKKGVLK